MTCKSNCFYCWLVWFKFIHFKISNVHTAFKLCRLVRAMDYNDSQ